MAGDHRRRSTDGTYLGETGQQTSRQPTGGGGLATSWRYLGNRRLAAVANSPGRGFALTTTATALVTAIAEAPSPPGQNWSYQYDAAHRLTGGNSTSEGSTSYALDAAGNITRFGTIAASYNSLDELTSLGGTAYSWDGAGDLAGYGARSFAWDGENRLVGITYGAQPPKHTAISYDGLGRRVAIADTDTAGTTTPTDYIWCGDRLCQAETATGAILRQYYPEGEYLPGSATALYYGPDQLGSVRDLQVTSPLTATTETYDYDPLGNPLAAPTSGPYPDFRYAGLFYHAASGLELSRSRPYFPALGRWLARDPPAKSPTPPPTSTVAPTATRSRSPIRADTLA